MAERKNILFLDFDGVLNSSRSFFQAFCDHFDIKYSNDDFSTEKWYGKGHMENMNPELWEKIEYAQKNLVEERGFPKIGMYDWPPEKSAIQNLNKIVEENNAKVVICSSWRHSKSPEELQEILDGWGFKGEVIDKTISLRSDVMTRGREILQWVMDHHSEIKGICILDDDAPYDINGIFEKWCVQDIHHSKHGLLRKHISEAKRCFDTPIDPLNDFDDWVPEDMLNKERKKYGRLKEIKITPDKLDEIKDNDNYNFRYFTVRNGKAKYHMIHLPDRSCGLYYALRESGNGLEGRRALEPTDEIICHVSLKNR